MLRYAMTLLLILAGSLFSLPARSHCEVPCGIYDDAMRIKMIAEHVTTIEKAMAQINELSQADSPNMNQLVRWITNKETHATEIQHIVTQYFMTQRIKFDTKDKDKKLALLHEMLVYAMKCKQTTDADNAAKLKKALEGFDQLYSHKH